MTKTRFKYYRNDDGTAMIYDKQKGEYLFCVDLDNLTDLLNEQSETITRLEKENEQLKKENKRLEKMNDNLADILVDNGLV